MDASRNLDLLLATQDSGECRALTALLKGALRARVAAHCSARAALSAAQHTPIDAAICTPDLGDAQWNQFAALLHTGRFGSADVPVCVLCQPHEIELLQPMADLHTFLIPYVDDSEITQSISDIVHLRTRPTLLIVEDEPNPALFAKTVLQKDFSVEHALDAESALVAWRARRHNLILLDLMLPGMSGAQMQRVVLSEYPEQPIIILTGNPSVENHQDLVLGGATDFLAKPASEQELKSACTLALRLARTRQLARRADERGTHLHTLSSRIRVASYSLRTGRADQASQHLERALLQCTQPTDDEWTATLCEFPEIRRSR